MYKIYFLPKTLSLYIIWESEQFLLCRYHIVFQKLFFFSTKYYFYELISQKIMFESIIRKMTKIRCKPIYTVFCSNVDYSLSSLPRYIMKFNKYLWHSIILPPSYIYSRLHGNSKRFVSNFKNVLESKTRKMLRKCNS